MNNKGMITNVKNVAFRKHPKPIIPRSLPITGGLTKEYGSEVTNSLVPSN